MTETANTLQTTTRCGRCGRVLRSTKSQSRGYGPTCQAKITAATKTATGKPAQIAKAVELVELGGIVPVRGRRIYRATSTDGTRTYLTAVTGQCNCPAGLHGHACYHVTAARLLAAA
jgi:hypothetical protein